MNDTKSLAVQEPQAIARTERGILTRDALKEAAEQRAILSEYVRSQMKQGTDFGVIPGTEKPTLLKPGAEKLVDLFRCTPKFKLVERVEDFEGNLFAYTFRVQLFQRDAQAVLAEGYGSANSREGRYRWRNANPKCPQCGKETLFRSKKDPGFYCWAKKGGCGAQFGAHDATVKAAFDSAGKVENDDVATLANTILKMAKKRCLGGNTPLLVRTQSGIVRADVEGLWQMTRRSTGPMWLPGSNGEWRLVTGIARQQHASVARIELRDGSYIHASHDHRFPTQRGLLEVGALREGDSLVRVPIAGWEPRHALLEYGRLAGLYLAEGHELRAGTSVRFTLHADEVGFAERIRAAAEPLGCRVSIKRRTIGNTLDVAVYGPAFTGLMRQFIDGKLCYGKHLSRFAFREGRAFLEALLGGYLDGDGCFQNRKRTPEHIIGFTGENRELAYDLRALAAILDKRLMLKRGTATADGKDFGTYTGWIKEHVERPHGNEADLEMVVGIREESRSAVLYDIEVDGDHLFALGNGILTHNSLVDGAIALARVSDLFTQDVEDLAEPVAENGAAPAQETAAPAQDAMPTLFDEHKAALLDARDSASLESAAVKIAKAAQSGRVSEPQRKMLAALYAQRRGELQPRVA